MYPVLFISLSDYLCLSCGVANGQLCSVMQFQQPRVLTSLACDLLGRMPSEGLCFLAVTLLPLQETAERFAWTAGS